MNTPCDNEKMAPSANEEPLSSTADVQNQFVAKRLLNVLLYYGLQLSVMNQNIAERLYACKDREECLNMLQSLKGQPRLTPNECQRILDSLKERLPELSDEECRRVLTLVAGPSELTDEVIQKVCSELRDVDDLMERLDIFLDTMMPEAPPLQQVITAIDRFIEGGIDWVSTLVKENTYVHIPTGNRQASMSSGPAADVPKSVEIVFEANCDSENMHYWTAILRIEGKYSPDQLVDIEVTDYQDKPIPLARLNFLGKILTIKNGHATITLGEFRKGLATSEVILTNALGESTPGSLVILKEHELR